MKTGHHVQLYARSARKWVRLSADFANREKANRWAANVRPSLRVRVVKS